ncbi:MAG: branched-chain amino acid ABC transporter permease [Chloroflexi bacterium]|nr:branched-chain amino acid ABC transporter permease [Chloroflexota bacterium]MCL5950937.1 branched-chain amino acid ABC transporter permease [Chloroflexota bacterium]
METLMQAVVSGALMGLVYALISVGLTLIFGLMEVVNFAHGQFLMLAMFASYGMSVLLGLDPLVSLPIVAVLLGILGLITNRLIILQVIRGPMVAQIFATFGLGIFLANGAQFLWSPDFRVVQNPWLGQLAGGLVRLPGGVYLGVPQLGAAVLAGVAFAALYLFITRTKTGLALQAVAEDKEAAALMGINSQRMYDVGWFLGLACVGVAGAALANFYYIAPQVGNTFAIIAYVVVALGGFGSVSGALLGGILVGLVEILSPVVLGISPDLKYAVVYSVYLLIVFIRPQGLLGRY